MHLHISSIVLFTQHLTICEVQRKSLALLSSQTDFSHPKTYPVPKRTGTLVISPGRLAKSCRSELGGEEEAGVVAAWLVLPCRLESRCQRDHVL